MNSLYVFIHIPKTAGTTFESILYKRFPENILTFRYPRGVDEDWDKVKCIRGHINMNHAENDINFRDREFVYFTFLRNPIERMYSNYYYAERDITIKQWLRSNDPFVENLMTKYLGNAGVNIPTESNLKIAMENLTRPDVNFGITEHFDESLKRFQVKFPDIFPSLEYEKKRISIKPDNYGDDPEITSMIIERNLFDLRLYEYALDLWRAK